MTVKITSCQEYFDRLGERFVADAAQGVNATFQFELTGDGGGTWHVTVDDGTMAVAPGAHPKPTAVVSAKADDYVKIANGEINGLRAVMSRKMKISGSLVVARKMQHMFPTGNI
ncbi:MAG: SCP2 sterol-binding domain-containing protein [Alphaproteobacteria bacterium]|nr:SCP2 sterol-binding domain-containing protein [Alphaproteobacteria bacterium]